MRGIKEIQKLNLGALFEVVCVGLSIMNLKLFGVILVRTLDRSNGKDNLCYFSMNS